jgi:hypothetical protein
MGFFIALNLAVTEFITKGICPQLVFFPACYLVLICFLIPLILQIINKGRIIFFVFIGIAFLLAIFASFGQFFNLISCPKTDIGIPKCYLSFALLLVIIWLKLKEK